MLRDTSVVPPDSVIKTFKHISGKDVDLVVSQDREDLCSDSYILKNSEWAKFFLDAWFDPLYRSYKFAKAEKHALVSFDPLFCFSSPFFDALSSLRVPLYT